LEDNDLKRLLGLRNAQEGQGEDMGAELGFCERHIYRLHKTAVAEFEKKLKDVM